MVQKSQVNRMGQVKSIILNSQSSQLQAIFTCVCVYEALSTDGKLCVCVCPLVKPPLRVSGGILLDGSGVALIEVSAVEGASEEARPRV